jgi:hypothetical protein
MLIITLRPLSPQICGLRLVHALSSSSALGMLQIPDGDLLFENETRLSKDAMHCVPMRRYTGGDHRQGVVRQPQMLAALSPSN